MNLLSRIGAMFLALAFACSVAFANGENHNGPANQGQNQGQAESQQQNQIQSVTAANGAQQNSQSFALAYPHQAPDVFAPPVYPTAPCVVGASGGGSWLTGAFGFGFGLKDGECQKLETARAFRQIGEDQAALHLLCTTRAARKAHLKVCRPFEHHKK